MNISFHIFSCHHKKFHVKLFLCKKRFYLNKKLAHPIFTQLILVQFLTTLLVHHTGNIDVVGWQDTTTTSETQRFNNWGLFDRQSRNLKSYCKEIVKEKEI